jgi:hypothetical protein
VYIGVPVLTPIGNGFRDMPAPFLELRFLCRFAALCRAVAIGCVVTLTYSLTHFCAACQPFIASRSGLAGSLSDDRATHKYVLPQDAVGVGIDVVHVLDG